MTRKRFMGFYDQPHRHPQSGVVTPGFPHLFCGWLVTNHAGGFDWGVSVEVLFDKRHPALLHRIETTDTGNISFIKTYFDRGMATARHIRYDIQLPRESEPALSARGQWRFWDLTTNQPLVMSPDDFLFDPEATESGSAGLAWAPDLRIFEFPTEQLSNRAEELLRQLE